MQNKIEISSQQPKRPWKVLHIEQDLSQAGKVIEVLNGDSESCFEYQIAADSAQAICAFEKNTYDFVICDLSNTNNLDFEVITQLRKRDATIPIIAIVPPENPNLVAIAIKSGASGCIIDDPRFLDKLNEFVKRQHGEDLKFAFGSAVNSRHADDHSDALRMGFLKESDELHRSLIDNLLSGVFSVQGDRFVYVNDRYAEIVGYSKEEIIGKMGPKDLIAPADMAIFRQKLADRESGKVKSVDYTVEVIRKDGKRIYCRVLSWSTHESGKKIIQGTITDVTRQREIEEKLKASEEKYRSLFTNAAYGIFQTSLDWQIITANPTFIKILGYQSEEELKQLQEPLSIFYNSAEFEKMHTRLLEENQLSEYFLTLRKKDDSPVVVRLNVRVVFNQRQGSQYLEGMLQDITEQMNAEAEVNRLANFLQRNPNPVLEISADGEILYFNPATSKLLEEFGIRQEDVHLLLPPHYRQHCQNMVQHDITNECVETILENRIFLWSFHFIPSESVFHLYGFDITERKNLERQLLHAQKMESIGTLAGGIAHDFNNLLMGIIGYTSIILADMPQDHPLFADILNIEKAAQKAADLTRQLLSFSRKAVGDPQIVSLNDLVEETISLFSRAIKNGVKIDSRLAHNLSGVFIDPAQLQQILMNLLVNAKDAMGKSGTISIYTEERVIRENDRPPDPEIKPGRYVLLTIEDEGTGILEENLDRIFEPFFTTKDVGKGTGLGLSLVYNYVKNAGGHITVRSKIGKGTTFTIFFKAYDIEESGELAEKEELSSGQEGILVVDDEETIIKIASRMLAAKGYQVFTAMDAKQALEIYEANQEDIDLILMDLTMPEMDGIELLQALRKISPKTRAILSSGFSKVESQDDLSALGVRKFLQKPFQFSELLQSVRAVLDEN